MIADGVETTFEPVPDNYAGGDYYLGVIKGAGSVYVDVKAPFTSLSCQIVKRCISMEILVFARSHM